jgi:hypothetical protein
LDLNQMIFYVIFAYVTISIIFFLIYKHSTSAIIKFFFSISAACLIGFIVSFVGFNLYMGHNMSFFISVFFLYFISFICFLLFQIILYIEK